MHDKRRCPNALGVCGLWPVLTRAHGASLLRSFRLMPRGKWRRVVACAASHTSSCCHWWVEVTSKRLVETSRNICVWGKRLKELVRRCDVDCSGVYLGIKSLPVLSDMHPLSVAGTPS